MKTKTIACLVALLLLGSRCSVREDFSADALHNYNVLWETLDKHYSFFDLKLPKDSTWRDMYYKHLPKIHKGMTNDSLFLVMTELMSELKDGHVNLITPFDYGRYWNWQTDYPSNFSADIVSHYLGDKYRMAGGLRYCMLEYNGHTQDSIGYLRFASFASSLSASNLNASLSRLSKCRALIIDIRSNGGGNVSTSDLFARHFMREERTVGTTRHKVGPGHQDFSSLTPIRLTPLQAGVKWLKPVILLTNRGVYSAANDFTLKMKGLPLVTVVGDRTGGGGGLPMSSELPNGWGIRFSSTQTFDMQGNNIELGIAPDYQVELKQKDRAKSRDTMIEYAITYINERYKEFERTKKWRK
ncbi:MAG: S41 family peptidase [Porphyromonadaceae bacterium]|nr:S41 family peptidase [Porphyromonadaceae bacterium]